MVNQIGLKLSIGTIRRAVLVKFVIEKLIKFLTKDQCYLCYCAAQKLAATWERRTGIAQMRFSKQTNFMVNYGAGVMDNI